MKIIEGIHSIFDGYLYDEHGLNCFLVPKYVASQAFRRINPDLYYFYLYTHLHYFFLSEKPYEHFMSNNRYQRDTIEEYVLSDKLGLKLEAVRIDNNLIEQVQQALVKDAIVFVPTNKRAIFYCEEYQRRDHPHLFLVKGFDEERNLAIIQDGEQNAALFNSPPSPTLRMSIGDTTSQFYLRNDMLESAFDAYNETYGYHKEHILIMSYSHAPSVHSAADAIKELSQLMSAYVGREQEILEPKLKYLIEEVDQFRIPYINTHMIFFRALARLIVQVPELQNRRTELDILARECQIAWKIIATKIGILHKRNRFEPEKLNESFSNVIVLEKKVINLVLDFGKMLRFEEMKMN
ncbi:hypothetical protein GK047_09650 [Paenibacillus sp. SYP-B3998]|uniref:Butirosin biosynthesis protein H N-terminal domain-containing protein n=1 Tax=Paenibacillus sp. SYP-B3998 TaxID=2678564 RepID=A0A6G3ZVY6_9BACL|nr:hypothetical protein [Paenibacillus sp. SYP-B3998]NEW06275.1 hypothetical protein [Paenibacillus sp. SYP-B3998]